MAIQMKNYTRDTKIQWKETWNWSNIVYHIVKGYKHATINHTRPWNMRLWVVSKSNSRRRNLQLKSCSRIGILFPNKMYTIVSLWSDRWVRMRIIVLIIDNCLIFLICNAQPGGEIERKCICKCPMHTQQLMSNVRKQKSGFETELNCMHLRMKTHPRYNLRI